MAWFGGKRRVAPIVWDYFGDVRNYVEPFAGSLAVLLGRPTPPKIETVNDLDCMISNFWRAIQASPADVAFHADWPVNEADLHARHLWLVNRVHKSDFREKVKTDPEFYEVKVAGWWVWGISQWIGSGWCIAPQQTGRTNAGRSARGIHTEVTQKRPYLTNHGGGDKGGRGVIRQRPDLSAGGRSVHAKTDGSDPIEGLYAWFLELATRLRRVRICCGEWERILGPATTTCVGTTAVFLDPPYSVDRDDVYNEESRDVSHKVREWAIANGDDQQLRIALCGYEGEHEMPASWSVVAWKANGGYGNTGQQPALTRGQENAQRERIWFSPHCLRPHEGLFREDLVYEELAG